MALCRALSPTLEEALLPRAEAGDIEAQGKLGSMLVESEGRQHEGWEWLCKAADQGDAEARHTIGWHFWLNRPPVGPDLVKADMWLTLAIQAGGEGSIPAWDANYRRDLVRNQMTPAQLAEAERMVAEWQPGQCEAEIKGAGAKAK